MRCIKVQPENNSFKEFPEKREQTFPGLDGKSEYAATLYHIPLSWDHRIRGGSATIANPLDSLDKESCGHTKSSFPISTQSCFRW